MKETKVEIASIKDAQIIKGLINEMYGFDYEKREISEIQKDISQNAQIYIIAHLGDEIVGFAGASTTSDEYIDVTNKTRAVIEYVYVKEKYRNFLIAYKLTKKLIASLVENDVSSAIMQVQTFNKQRFFHYALCDKNIIKSTQVKNYQDQILLIEDLKGVLNQSFQEFLSKVKRYSKELN